MTIYHAVVKRFYAGLAATLHDPAVAIVGPSGDVLFAEATERHLQWKRAYDCPPDDMLRMPELIHEFCDPDAELVGAVSWSTPFLSGLALSTAGAVMPPASGPRDDLTWPLPDLSMLTIGLRNSISQAGLNLAGSRRIPNRVVVKRFDHHACHAAAAVFTGPFEESVVAVIDGSGESSSTSFFRAERGDLTPLRGGPPRRADRMPVSLGLFFSRLCEACGFDFLRGEEWKVMGLAAYGRPDPRIYELLRPTVSVDWLGLTSECSEPEVARRWRRARAEARPPGSSPLEAADVAATGQQIFEEVVVELLANAHTAGGSDNLALAGGCALNSTCNGHVLERTPFRALHVPAAPGDDGNALGAAILAWREDHPDERPSQSLQSPYIGSRIAPFGLENLRRFGGLPKMTVGVRDAPRKAAALIAAGKIVGWIQGRSEFGPRALGNRSILADPRPRDMQDRINARVKFREEFRPFAPSILDEHGPAYFENYQTSPYMERTLRFRSEVVDLVPAVVHVDGTGRLQSVRREWNPQFHSLLAAFFEATGIPLVLNTSYNVMGKPIVHSVEDVLGLFFTCGLDALVIEDVLIEK